MTKRKTKIDWSQLPDTGEHEKPKLPPVSNEKLVKMIITPICDISDKLENVSIQLKPLPENLVSLANTMTELIKNRKEAKIEPPKIDKKRKWNMEVIRDNRGLIKSIVAEEF